MTKATFEIGEKEKHNISVTASVVLKYIRIEVDGKRIINNLNFQPLPKNFELEVGNLEKHHVEISAGPFSPVHLLVDGKEVQKN
jgi:hypothetical protein